MLATLLQYHVDVITRNYFYTPIKGSTFSLGVVLPSGAEKYIKHFPDISPEQGKTRQESTYPLILTLILSNFKNIFHLVQSLNLQSGGGVLLFGVLKRCKY